MQRKKDLEEKAYKLALAEWQKTLRASEVAQIAPNKKASGDITPQSAKLGLYFKENIWPTLKSEYSILNV